MNPDKKDIEVFQESFKDIFSAITALGNLGVKPRETISFITKFFEREVFFSSKFYFDWGKRNFVFETDFPENFDYYKELIPMFDQFNREEKERNAKKKKKNSG